MKTTIYAKVTKGNEFTEGTIKAFNDYSLDYYAYLHSNGTISISYAYSEIPVEEQKSMLLHLAGQFREIDFI